MFWLKVTHAFNITGIENPEVWQSIIVSSILIPVILILLRFVGKWWNSRKPLSQLLNGFTAPKTRVLIFLSQLSAVNSENEIDVNQRYAAKFRSSTTRNRSAVGLNLYQNIDPVWSEADGESLADVYNILGRAGKTLNISVGHLINNWDEWQRPTFSIGFNPRTRKLMEKCEPIHFQLHEYSLTIDGCGEELSAVLPDDAAIIQKTYIKNTKVPVFILAGLGTIGTSAAGYFMQQNFVDIGKLYGSRPFCFLLKLNFEDGRTSVFPKAVYPNPSLMAVLTHPLTFIKYKNLGIFPKKAGSTRAQR